MEYRTPSYVLAEPLRHFINSAFMEKADLCHAQMKNFIDAENGHQYALLTSKEKQLISIKKDMRKAFRYYSKLRLGRAKKQILRNCIARFEFARDSTTLLEIINEMRIISC